MERSVKLQLVSRVLRFFTWAAIGVLLIAGGLRYFGGFEQLTFGFITLNMSALNSIDFEQLWDTPGMHRTGLVLFIIPKFFLPLANLFWLQRLFGYYGNGVFFGDAVMRCYFVLIWTRMAIVVYHGIFDTIIISLLSNKGSMHIDFVFDIEQILTFSLLLIIVYVLKIAGQIDEENRKFV